jgi:hypothetical protein
MNYKACILKHSSNWGINMNKKMETKDLQGEWRMHMPENLIGIPYIESRRTDGTKMGMQSVDGHYWIDGKLVKQIREYDVKTPEEAVKRAKVDGLARGIMVETILMEGLL